MEYESLEKLSSRSSGDVFGQHDLDSRGDPTTRFFGITPHAVFYRMLRRRPLEDLQAKGGNDAVKAEVAAPPPHVAAVALTPEERMGIVRGATKMSELLRSTLRRGAYFEGAAGVHSFVEVHRAALRAAATLMRKVRFAVRSIPVLVAVSSRYSRRFRN